MIEKDFNYYRNMIQQQKIPDDFDQWLMKNDKDDTLAHFAAFRCVLPVNWTNKTKDWLIKDSGGITVAHYYVRASKIPKNWTSDPEDWLVKTKQGGTIAHWSLFHGYIPKNWTNLTKHWLVTDESGDTIAHLAALRNQLPMDWTDNPEDWFLMNGKNQTIGLLMSYGKEDHYNQPKTLVEYCKNMEDHLLPCLDYCIDDMNVIDSIQNFFLPFNKKIHNTQESEWLETSNLYSGFLIDYVESIVYQIKDNLTQADYVQKHAINNEKKISLQIENVICHIEEKKRKIKESLFHNLSHEDSFNHQDLDNGL